MKKSVLLLATVFALYFNAEAKYTQNCIARYMTQEGWSKKYTVDVTFYSGSELNEATNSFKYSSFSVYAVIFWDEGKATVIELSNFLTCGTTVDKSCIKNTIYDLNGKDQDGDEWKICVSDYCL